MSFFLPTSYKDISAWCMPLGIFKYLLSTRRNADILTKLIIFIVDLTLALAIFAILYAVYLIAATGIFISLLFYIFKWEMGINYDFSKGSLDTGFQQCS